MTGGQFEKTRIMLGLSQNAMGRAIGHLDGRQVRYYENGERPVPPTIAILMRIYAVMGKVPKWVLE